ncbi:hypothetical protein EYC80_003013 [Monilinia laxa]|uniref:Complex III subunit 7 n=1 Tax=Monilinia laxa TaxID=61186 RepID=A0A5N6KCI3_MONLA|nr:hypothetical protein EYC80_003013 [Monilinia laxa]
MHSLSLSIRTHNSPIMSAPSLASWIVKKPGLLKIMQPLASWYTNAAGYRQLGLRADDLLPEESEEVLLALKQLSSALSNINFCQKTNTPSLKKITHTFHPSLQKSKPKLRNVLIWSP